MRPENMYPFRCMRTCETCGVGIGIMTRATFFRRYVVGRVSCPYCGGVVDEPEARKPVVDAEYVSLERAAVRYEASEREIRDAVLGGDVRAQRIGRGMQYSASDLERLFELRAVPA